MKHTILNVVVSNNDHLLWILKKSQILWDRNLGGTQLEGLVPAPRCLGTLLADPEAGAGEATSRIISSVARLGPWQGRQRLGSAGTADQSPSSWSLQHGSLSARLNF